MADLKLHRESENRIHEQLYDNLFLLSQLYPPSKEFNAVLKKDMFVKNNKAAFFEVVYYLLNVLNPDLTKEKLTAWPPYDIKRETKLRMEILKYINELNTVYDNADVPHIMSSHLISPGGMKFTKFMLKLSQLVVFEHLKRTEQSDILYCPKVSKNVNLNKVVLNNLRKRSNLIAQDTKEVMKNFESFHFEAKEKAVSVDKDLEKLNEDTRIVKEENIKVREDFSVNHSDYPSSSVIENKISSLKCQYEDLKQIHELYKECENLKSYLNSNELVLEHCKEELKVPNEVLHIVKNRDELDLGDFFRGLNMLLERKALEFPYPTEWCITSSIKKVEEFTAVQNRVSNNATESVRELQDVLEKMSQHIKLLVERNNSDGTEEILAVALKD